MRSVDFWSSGRSCNGFRGSQKCLLADESLASAYPGPHLSASEADYPCHDDIISARRDVSRPCLGLSTVFLTETSCPAQACPVVKHLQEVASVLLSTGSPIPSWCYGTPVAPRSGDQRLGAQRLSYRLRDLPRAEPLCSDAEGKSSLFKPRIFTVADAQLLLYFGADSCLPADPIWWRVSHIRPAIHGLQMEARHGCQVSITHQGSTLLDSEGY